MMFTDAYAGYSVCAPSRMSLMTGYHSGHIGSSNLEPLLNTSYTTMPDVLRKAGYKTALIGKWGLDGNWEYPQPPGDGFPTKNGFDSYLGQSNQVQCHNYYPSFQFQNSTNTTISANANASELTCGEGYGDCKWSGDIWTDAAVAYLKAHAAARTRAPATDKSPPPDAATHAATHAARAAADDAAKPFFLFLSYTTPHAGGVGTTNETGVPSPRQNTGPYANKTQWPEVERAFATAVWDLDQAVGRVMDALDGSGLGNDTLVLFASDNGAHAEGGHDYQFFNSSGYLNGFKRSIHDGGHRTGFIARWLGSVPANTVTRQQVAFYDLLPTLAELAGASADTLPPKLDGQSVAATLLRQEENQPEYIYHEFAGCQDPICKATPNLPCHFGQNVRMGNWSGVCLGKKEPCTGKAPGKFLLYDMSVDEGQEHDVSVMHPTVVQSILSIMQSQHNKNWPSKKAHSPA